MNEWQFVLVVMALVISVKLLDIELSYYWEGKHSRVYHLGI